MKIIRFALAAVLWVGLLEATQATNRYVSSTGTNNPPYTNWADAATNIQAAISACSSGDVVWVTNGTYQTGGVTNWPSGTTLTNRVAITNTITVRSMNGPSNTIIKGTWATTTNGARVARCVYMTNGSALIGFTLTNGATMTDDEGAPNDAQRGGGVWCESTNTIISNCVITCNAANQRGGGAYYGTLYNCLLITNLAADIDAGPGAGYGGGTYYSTLYNCTLSDNTAQFGAEANYGIAFNSILWPGANLNIATWYHSCAPDNGGATSVTNDPYSTTNNPLFLNSTARNYRLSGNSPCINAGTNQNWMTNAVDLDGRQRIMQVTADMGAYESAYSISILTNAFTNTVMIGSSVTNFSIYLVNTNETTLYWEAVNTSSWVTLSATNGTIPTNATHDAIVTNIITNSAVGLALGAHYSRLNVHTTNYTYRSTGTVDMILNIAEFGRSATSLTAAVKQGNATNETVRIWNKGAGALSYTVSTNV
ncbi:MAG: choice-of-anchor Q domain-containing protein, partial [Kiritimatiellia bacterium]|nr:choice-of-anchor Q domain-containing protein [Kiritimatiellia bacterium]